VSAAVGPQAGGGPGGPSGLPGHVAEGVECRVDGVGGLPGVEEIWGGGGCDVPAPGGDWPAGPAAARGGGAGDQLAAPVPPERSDAFACENSASVRWPAA